MQEKEYLVEHFFIYLIVDFGKVVRAEVTEFGDGASTSWLRWSFSADLLRFTGPVRIQEMKK